MATRTQRVTPRAVHLCHALSDDTRLQIVERLRNGERCVCELTDALDAAQSRLSFHLKILKDAGLVTDRRDGRWVYYSLRPEAFDVLVAAIKALKPKRGALPIASDGSGCCS